MKEEKNLDRLFQEKFKDFERHPSDAVWKNIAAAKNEEEDRKIIPLWWKLGGAAAITLLLTTGIVLFNNTATNALENSVVTTSDTPGTNTPQTTQSQQTVTSIVNTENTNALSEVVANGTDNNVTNNTPSRQEKETVNTITPKQAVYVQNINQTPATGTIRNTTAQNSTASSQDALNGVAVTQQNKQNENTLLDEVKTQELLKEQIKANSAVTQTTQDVKETPQEIKGEKISLIDEAKRIKEENEAVAIVEDTSNLQRWDVGAVAAPVFYGDFGGSGLDPTFSDNAKSSDVNFSYGVQVSYAVNPKLKVRTGVSNVDLSYNTDGIAFVATPNARRITGINYNQNAQALNIGDSGSARVEGAIAQDDLFPENTNAPKIVDGSLQQRLGFVEIPVEAVYVVSDKRLGVQVVGGVSTLLLNNNEVILNAVDGLQSNLGSANGINDVSFTTNIGLGLDYKMTDKLKLNVEPSLKYQLNAFDQSVGDFKPYFVGLYTGVSYRF